MLRLTGPESFFGNPFLSDLPTILEGLQLSMQQLWAAQTSSITRQSAQTSILRQLVDNRTVPRSSSTSMSHVNFNNSKVKDIIKIFDFPIPAVSVNDTVQDKIDNITRLLLIAREKDKSRTHGGQEAEDRHQCIDPFFKEVPKLYKLSCWSSHPKWTKLELCDLFEDTKCSGYPDLTMSAQDTQPPRLAQIEAKKRLKDCVGDMPYQFLLSDRHQTMAQVEATRRFLPKGVSCFGVLSNVDMFVFYESSGPYEFKQSNVIVDETQIAMYLNFICERCVQVENDIPWNSTSRQILIFDEGEPDESNRDSDHSGDGEVHVSGEEKGSENQAHGLCSGSGTATRTSKLERPYLNAQVLREHNAAIVREAWSLLVRAEN